MTNKTMLNKLRILKNRLDMTALEVHRRKQESDVGWKLVNELKRLAKKYPDSSIAKEAESLGVVAHIAMDMIWEEYYSARKVMRHRHRQELKAKVVRRAQS